MKTIKVVYLSNTLISLMQSRFKAINSIKRFLTVQRARSLAFDIFNLHGISREGVEIAKICRRRRIPIVYTAHGAAYKEKELGYPYPKWFVTYERKILSIADKIIAVSDNVKNLLIDKYSLPHDKIDVIYNGIDPYFGRRKYRYVNIRKKYNIPAHRKILLNVGGTQRVKDIPFLIQALKLLKRKDWHLVLVGPKGEDHENVIRKCQRKLEGHYVFTGEKKTDELLNFYHQSDLYITTSKYETYGLTILEAMSCGLSVIMRSTIGAAKHLSSIYPELRKNVFSTPQELAELINKYLDGNYDIKREYYQKKILTDNSWENRAKEYIRIFTQLIEERIQ